VKKIRYPVWFTYVPYMNVQINGFLSYMLVNANLYIKVEILIIMMHTVYIIQSSKM